MNIKIVSILSLFSVASFVSAQTSMSSMDILGNLRILDDPNTTPVEGNVRITGSLVLSDGADAQVFATGRNSIAGGYRGRSYGDYSIAIGGYDNAAQAFGLFNIAIGNGAVSGSAATPGSHNIAYGRWASATGSYCSVAIGNFANASNTNSTALGYGAKGAGFGASAIGLEAEATHSYALGLGAGAKANGYRSGAVGFGAIAAQSGSFAAGYITESLGANSTAIGHYTVINSPNSYAIGHRLNTEVAYEYIIGYYNELTTGNASTWVATDPLFVIGNGRGETTRSNALVMLKNGDTSFAGTIKAKPSNALPMGNFGRL